MNRSGGLDVRLLVQPESHVSDESNCIFGGNECDRKARGGMKLTFLEEYQTRTVENIEKPPLATRIIKA